MEIVNLTSSQKLDVLATTIEFFNTIPESGFVRNQQVKDFNPENLNKCHCALGWLYLCEDSPFYDPSKHMQYSDMLVPNYDYHRVKEQDLIGQYFVEELRIVHINNNAPGSIKQTLLTHLYNEYANLIAQEHIDDLLQEKQQPKFKPDAPSKRMSVMSRIKNFIKNINK